MATHGHVTLSPGTPRGSNQRGGGPAAAAGAAPAAGHGAAEAGAPAGGAPGAPGARKLRPKAEGSCSGADVMGQNKSNHHELDHGFLVTIYRGARVRLGTPKTARLGTPFWIA